MVKTSRAVEYYNGNTPQYYRKRGFKDRTNNFFWSACCYSPGQVRSEPRWACQDLQICSTVNFPTEKSYFSEYPSPKPTSRKLQKIKNTQEQKFVSPTLFKEMKDSVKGYLFENSEVLVERTWSKERWDCPHNQEKSKDVDYQHTEVFNALKKSQKGFTNQQGVATSSCYSQKEQPWSKNTKPGLSQSSEESCSGDLYPAEIQPVYPCVTIRHASEESLLLQYHDHELSESSVLSLMSNAAAGYQIQRVKSGIDEEVFQKAEPNAPFDLIHQPVLRNKSFQLGHKYPLCSLIKSGKDDLDQEIHTADQLIPYGLPLHSKNAMLSVSTSDQRATSCDQMKVNKDEKPQNVIYESVVSTISSIQNEPVKDDSNKCSKERPKFVLPTLRSGWENNNHQDDDLSIKRLNKKSSESTRSIPKIESDSTSPPQSVQAFGNTPDRTGLKDRRRKYADCRSIRLFNDEYPLLITESTKNNLNDYQNFDADIKALLQALETTTNNFRTSVLQQQG